MGFLHRNREWQENNCDLLWLQEWSQREGGKLKVNQEKCPSLATQGSKKRPEPVGDVPQKTTTMQVEAPTTCTTEQPTKRLKLQQSQINSYGCQTDVRTQIQLDHQLEDGGLLHLDSSGRHPRGQREVRL